MADHGILCALFLFAFVIIISIYFSLFVREEELVREAQFIELN
jgi:hypothetical protein